MPPIPIDTQEVVERLTDAGVPERQAKAHASVLLDSLQHQDDDLRVCMCTKADLAAAIEPVIRAITDLEAKIAMIEAKLDAKIDGSIARLKGEVITWLISLGILQSGLAILLKFWQ